MPRRRSGHTTAVTIGAERFYLTANQRHDGTLGEVFIHWGKHGTSGAGLVSTYAIALSMGLAHRVPLAELIRPGLDQYFMPNGRTDDPEIPRVWSAVDYIARRLALDWLPYPDRAGLGVYTLAERIRRWELTAGFGAGGYVGLRVQPAQEVPGRPRRFLADLPGHRAGHLERDAGRVPGVGVPGLLSGSTGRSSGTFTRKSPARVAATSRSSYRRTSFPPRKEVSESTMPSSASTAATAAGNNIINAHGASPRAA